MEKTYKSVNKCEELTGQKLLKGTHMRSVGLETIN